MSAIRWGDHWRRIGDFTRSKGMNLWGSSTKSKRRPKQLIRSVGIIRFVDRTAEHHVAEAAGNGALGGIGAAPGVLKANEGTLQADGVPDFDFLQLLPNLGIVYHDVKVISENSDLSVLHHEVCGAVTHFSDSAQTRWSRVLPTPRGLRQSLEFGISND